MWQALFFAKLYFSKEDLSQVGCPYFVGRSIKGAPQMPQIVAPSSNKGWHHLWFYCAKAGLGKATRALEPLISTLVSQWLSGRGVVDEFISRRI